MAYLRSANLSNTALADRMGIHRTTLQRHLAGVIRPGEDFIGALLLALPKARFEDLFEVAPAREAS
ncbi:helix-turn-helix domain-containing protein [Streptoalloteichus tenebrarius]|nr:helix-turn-helix transcriptional regulator [Streptoalloteichus tenebrarius]